MTMKGDAKFERKLTWSFRNDMSNLANFYGLKNCEFILESKIAELNLFTLVTESLFLRYKKISKKAVKLGSFLQYSVHLFLRHDDCFWKTNLRILWNHIMKDFRVKHGQSGSVIFPKTSSYWTFDLLAAGFFTFDRSWNLSTNLSQNSLSFVLVWGWGWGGGCRIISNFTKEETFFISYDN